MYNFFFSPIGGGGREHSYRKCKSARFLEDPRDIYCDRLCPSHTLSCLALIVFTIGFTRPDSLNKSTLMESQISKDGKGPTVMVEVWASKKSGAVVGSGRRGGILFASSVIIIKKGARTITTTCRLAYSFLLERDAGVRCLSFDAS